MQNTKTSTTTKRYKVSNLEKSLNFMREACEVNNLRLKFVTNKCGYQGSLGYDVILMNSKLKKNAHKMLSVFFHEMAHLECRIKRLFPAIHLDLRINASKKSIEKRRLAALRTVVRVEKFVDNKAAENMKEYFPYLKFYPVNPKNCKKYWDDYKKGLKDFYGKILRDKG